MKNLVIFLGIFCFFISLILASPLAPSPNCEITGKINSIHLSYQSICTNNEVCVTPAMTSIYLVNVSINHILYTNGSLNYSTCEELFKIGEEHQFIIDSSKFNNSFEGESIKMITSSSNYIQSYSLIGNYCVDNSDCPNPRPEGVCGGCFGECNENQCIILCADCPRQNIFQKIISWIKSLF